MEGTQQMAPEEVKPNNKYAPFSDAHAFAAGLKLKSRKDAESLKTTLHTKAGSVANIGGKYLAHLCRALENDLQQRGQNIDSHSLTRQLQKITKEQKLLEKFLLQRVREHHDP